LISRKANLNVYDKENKNILHHAIKNSDFKMAEILLKYDELYKKPKFTEIGDDIWRSPFEIAV